MKKFSEKLTRWIAYHEILAAIIISILCCSVYTFIFCGGITSLFVVVGGNIFVIYLVCRFVSYRKHILINKAFDKLDRECDPYPLYVEVSDLLKSAVRNKNTTQLFLMYKHNALTHMGDFEQAYATLSEVDVSKMSKKFVASMSILHTYYMFSLCDKMGRDSEADHWYNKLLDDYSAVRDPLTIGRVGRSVENAKLTDMFRRGEYEAVIEMMEDSTTPTKLSEIIRAMRYAKCYVGLGDTENAREQLEFVIENGGKLYYVKQAEEMMETL
ncbi:MAG: hypothetical protein E7628_06575 [Ruminococcaceae bacterium]|nr:hypothetical protein [Oscillospiraceae bacterium]